MLNILFNDIEYWALFILMLVVLIKGIKRKQVATKGWSMDRSMSQTLKGVSCIWILMSHFFFFVYPQADIPKWHLSWWCGQICANTALVIFMFISGYGLTVSHKGKEVFGIFLKRRMGKVYSPLLIVCVVTTVFYFLLPSSVLKIDMGRMGSEFLTAIQAPSRNMGFILLSSIGYLDWYVTCICVFYLFFWLASNIFPKYQTELLLGLMIIYYIAAYLLVGPAQAHYYRYPWAFLAGHLVVVTQACSMQWRRSIGVIYTFFMLLSFLNECIIMILAWTLAIVILFISFKLNRNYQIDSKILMYMGAISYFFYLTHVRIGFVFVGMCEFYSVFSAIILSIIASEFFNRVYQRVC